MRILYGVSIVTALSSVSAFGPAAFGTRRPTALLMGDVTKTGTVKW